MRFSHLALFLAAFCTSCQPIAIEAGKGATQSAVVTTATPSPMRLADTATISRVVIATRDPSTIMDAGQAIASEDAAALAAEGLQIYRDQYCGICHQSTAAGTSGKFGPTHDGLAAVAARRIQDSSYQGAATTVPDYLYECLIEPQRYIVPGYELTPHRMPSYSFLSAQQLSALVQFLEQQ